MFTKTCHWSQYRTAEHSCWMKSYIMLLEVLLNNGGHIDMSWFPCVLWHTKWENDSCVHKNCRNYWDIGLHFVLWNITFKRTLIRYVWIKLHVNLELRWTNTKYSKLLITACENVTVDVNKPVNIRNLSLCCFSVHYVRLVFPLGF
jgi:hypothetical protein